MGLNEDLDSIFNQFKVILGFFKKEAALEMNCNLAKSIMTPCSG